MPWLEWTFLGVFVLLVPVLSVRTARQIRDLQETPARSSVFASIIASQLIFLALALAVAKFSGFSLWPKPAWNAPAAGWALAVFLVTIALLLWRLRARDATLERALEIILPHTPRDLPMFAVVCAIVGVTEEVVYRGVMTHILVPLLDSWWLAAVLSTCAFALAHAMQGAINVLAVVLIALALHALVRVSDNLYWAIALHAIYDFVAAVIYVYIARPRWIAKSAVPSENTPPPIL